MLIETALIVILASGLALAAARPKPARASVRRARR